ncbi:peptidoglycan recognition protein [Streptomyces sp. BPTC-684]|uniref:peptidoglycan recognition protein family protein n=1 Tax=Streptomyces sp. BPTC-684 TaxID=3043734 RepID=UPI0024B0F52A|nr:peptidoglycan recognition protein [Streptomyces sp. BPTC-684]WHM38429.1 peptidoglycan recognition protein [Streptomyces sp. BPTC-684]
MRALLASSISVACATALALPLAASADAAATTPSSSSSAELAGSTQSLPLAPLGATDRTLGAAPAQGLPERNTAPFSLLGVVWDDAKAELHGTVQVRTRPVGSRAWSGWQDVDTRNQEHAPDPGTAEYGAARVHGSTAPLWVGRSDGVEVRVRPEAAGADRAMAGALPRGLHIDLVDPGADPDGVGAVDEAEREDGAEPVRDRALASGAWAAARPYIGPRPRIITRHGWGADEQLREPGYVYTGKIKAAFVHHTASGNNYRCSQAASVLRSIYRYHVRSSGWRDIGYNFAVDKCGNIYEGRAGGVAKPVLGAHTLGFNTDSMGVAVLGTYTSTNPSAAALDAIARLTAWKLGLYGVDPTGTTHLTSAGGNLYGKGRSVRLNIISGHRDGFATECPGTRLYKKLGKARSSSARLQGRR